MKYFTKEELEDITSELLNNPTRETLKSLNDKYNGVTEVVEPLAKEEVSTNVEPPVMMTIPNSTVQEKPVEPVAPVVNEPQVASPIPSFNIPNIEVPKTENQVNNSTTVAVQPSFELPKLETPTFNNQNNEPVSFSGDLWNLHQPEQQPSNLMQTTDNFNAVPTQAPTNEVPVTGAPFFSANPAPANNPIPVQGPTMFGQMQQNYM